MEFQFPYKAEYAKTGRASCKGCKSSIEQGSLRIAAMVQSAFHDGRQPNWFHESCFFQKQRPTSVGDIEHFESLRMEHQQKLEKKISELSAVVPSKAGKKRSNAEKGAMKDFGIEYAKSGRANCRGCEQKILKDQIRIKKVVYDTEVGRKYGGETLWHHVECFAQVRTDLGWLEKGEFLPGFDSLKEEDKSEVKKALPAMKLEDVPALKKAKIEPKDEVEIKEEKKLTALVKAQLKRVYFFWDKCKDKMKKSHIIELLELNNQTPATGDSEKLFDQISDMLTFGAIKPCPECNSSQMLFQKSGYVCNGNLTEWTKCSKLITEPERVACKIPSDFKDKFDFLREVRDKTEIRAIRYIPPSSATIANTTKINKDDELDGPKVKRERPPMYEWLFAHIGLKNKEEELKNRLAALGGKLSTRITDKTVAVFSTPSEVKRLSTRMQSAQQMGIHVIPVEYLDSVESNNANALNYISSMSLCDWGTNPSNRLPQEAPRSSKSKSIYTKSVPKSITLKVKDGLAVDPNSGLEDVAHVYVSGKDKFNVVLGLTDIQKNKNSYYKMQLLVADSEKKFWVFRSWGRIGTSIGGDKLESYSSLIEAIKVFHNLYLEKTGNDFESRHEFVKVPGCMYPIDVEFVDEKNINTNSDDNSLIKSKLDPSVQSLIKLIFDIEVMKRTMLEFNLDMEKLPLGKLSQKQIQKAYQVLTEILNLIEKGGSQSAFIDATNRFYTLIPHNFGIDIPPLLKSLEQVESLRQMLDSLLEIECAYSLLKTEDDKEHANPLDKHYDQLKTNLEPLDKASDEFSLLKKYVKNTHAKTHQMYDLEIIDIFKVSRQGESRRYKPFKKLHNRKLLWHGSRLSNFAGILSHGLKIAPPEAPATGYMFGKGIYFADMVSKSANYCCTSNADPTGLLLLSEVALGDMLECTAAKFITKLPDGKHSCFGRGRTMPDPKESYTRDDGVEIPLGKPITDNKLKSSLLYNEYIVYDIAQVNIQYLFRIEFKYKY